MTANEVLNKLQKSIELFREYERIIAVNPTAINKQIFLAARGSMIQRFKYCTDLFWKLLKVYLEEVEKVDLTVHSPRGVIRAIVKVETVHVREGKECMEMITSRNQTSHIYHEEIASDIARKIPEFYKLMTTITNRVQEKIA